MPDSPCLFEDAKGWKVKKKVKIILFSGECVCFCSSLSFFFGANYY